MKRKKLYSLIALLITVGLWQQPVPQAAAVVTTSLVDGIVLNWQAPAPQFSETADGKTKVEMADYERLQKSGYYDLPIQSLLVALPPNAQPQLTTKEVTTPYIKRIRTLLAVVPFADGVVLGPEGMPVGGVFKSQPDEQPRTLPIVSLEEIGVMRGVRLARVTFSPVQLSGNSLSIVSAVQARINFGATVSKPMSQSANPIHQLVAGMVVNPEQIQPAKHQPAPQAVDERQTAVLELVESGLTAVTYEQLAVAGFPVDGVNPHRLQLRQGETEIATEWDGDADLLFEPGEQLLFVAQPRFSRWQAGDAYLLSEIETAVLRMGTTSAAPTDFPPSIATTQTVYEENQQYTPNCYCGSLPAGRDGDRWVWNDLRRPGQPVRTYAFTQTAVSSSHPASLTLWLTSFTSAAAQSPDHRVSVALNEVLLGEIAWDGRAAISSTLTIPAGVLADENNLALSLLSIENVAVEGVWLDAFAVEAGKTAVLPNKPFSGQAGSHTYEVVLAQPTADVRLYNVTNPAVPQRLADWELDDGRLIFSDRASKPQTYLLGDVEAIQRPETIRLAAQTAPEATEVDYLIVTPADFQPALAPLVALRESQGLATAIVETEWIGDAFGNGRFDPPALQMYLRHTYQQWQPTYVVLVGDGTSDPRQYHPASTKTWIPPYLADSDPWIGEIAADNRYVAVDGDDLLPDMAIGRLPVNSLAEAEQVIAKLVAYENEQTQQWARRALLVADDKDAAGDFAHHADRLANHLPKFWQLQRFYHDQPAPITTDQITTRWDDGAGLVVYNGHSSIHQWGAERFFHLDDVETLKNGRLLPIVLQMTCFTGSFQLPAFDALDETLLRHPDGGAVAVWGSTGLGVATGHHHLAAGFIDSLTTQETPTLGLATLAGKLNLAGNQLAHHDLLDSFTLLGDPATHYPTAAFVGTAVFLPVVSNLSR